MRLAFSVRALDHPVVVWLDGANYAMTRTVLLVAHARALVSVLVLPGSERSRFRVNCAERRIHHESIFAHQIEAKAPLLAPECSDLRGDANRC